MSHRCFVAKKDGTFFNDIPCDGKHVFAQDNTATDCLDITGSDFDFFQKRNENGYVHLNGNTKFKETWLSRFKNELTNSFIIVMIIVS